MTIGLENLTTNTTANATAIDIQSHISTLIGEQMAGSYEIIGFIFLAVFVIALYKAKVSVDTGIVFMTPALFIFGKYGMLPGGAGSVYGLVLAVGGLLAAGLFRYFR